MATERALAKEWTLPCWCSAGTHGGHRFETRRRTRRRCRTRRHAARPARVSVEGCPEWRHVAGSGREQGHGGGRAKGQLLNCFVVPTADSREGWAKAVSDMLIISGTGGGVGMNFSPIRPRGTPIRGTGGEATGAVSLMEVINQTGEVIKAGGGRRTALMMCLRYDHADILEFMNRKFNKLDLEIYSKLSKFSIFDHEVYDYG